MGADGERELGQKRQGADGAWQALSKDGKRSKGASLVKPSRNDALERLARAQGGEQSLDKSAIKIEEWSPKEKPSPFHGVGRSQRSVQGSRSASREEREE